eukprot:jgi/Botrbrau1/14098/Bobra.182_3s0043.2
MEPRTEARFPDGCRVKMKDAEELLDFHIYDYLLKKNLTECATVFQRDRRRLQECRPGGNSVKAFLMDWWVIFWEIYSLRPPSKYAKMAHTNFECEELREEAEAQAVPQRNWDVLSLDHDFLAKPLLNRRRGSTKRCCGNGLAFTDLAGSTLSGAQVEVPHSQSGSLRPVAQSAAGRRSPDEGPADVDEDDLSVTSVGLEGSSTIPVGQLRHTDTASCDEGMGEDQSLQTNYGQHAQQGSNSAQRGVMQEQLAWGMEEALPAGAVTTPRLQATSPLQLAPQEVRGGASVLLESRSTAGTPTLHSNSFSGFGQAAAALGAQPTWGLTRALPAGPTFAECMQGLSSLTPMQQQEANAATLQDPRRAEGQHPRHAKTMAGCAQAPLDVGQLEWGLARALPAEATSTPQPQAAPLVPQVPPPIPPAPPPITQAPPSVLQDLPPVPPTQHQMSGAVPSQEAQNIRSAELQQGMQASACSGTTVTLGGSEWGLTRILPARVTTVSAAKCVRPQPQAQQQPPPMTSVPQARTAQYCGTQHMNKVSRPRPTAVPLGHAEWGPALALPAEPTSVQCLPGAFAVPQVLQQMSSMTSIEDSQIEESSQHRLESMTSMISVTPGRTKGGTSRARAPPRVQGPSPLGLAPQRLQGFATLIQPMAGCDGPQAQSGNKVGAPGHGQTTVPPGQAEWGVHRASSAPAAQGSGPHSQGKPPMASFGSRHLAQSGESSQASYGNKVLQSAQAGVIPGHMEWCLTHALPLGSIPSPQEQGPRQHMPGFWSPKNARSVKISSPQHGDKMSGPVQTLMPPGQADWGLLHSRPLEAAAPAPSPLQAGQPFSQSQQRFIGMLSAQHARLARIQQAQDAWTNMCLEAGFYGSAEGENAPPRQIVEPPLLDYFLSGE